MATYLVIYSELDLVEIDGDNSVSFDIIKTNNIQEDLIDRVVDPEKYGWLFGPFNKGFNAVVKNVIVIPIPEDIWKFEDFVNFGEMLQEKYLAIEAEKRFKASQEEAEKELQEYLRLKAKFERKI